MQDAQTCTSCGAKNSASAAWCTQCYTPFGEAANAPTSAPAGGLTADEAAAIADATSALQGADAGAAGPGTASPGTDAVAMAEAATTAQQAAVEPMAATGGDTPRADKAAETDTVDAESSATWTCKRCETVNPVTSNHCTICNTSIFETFGAGMDAGPVLESNEAIAYGLIPGFAHMKMGYGLLGAIIAILVATLWFMGILLIVGGQILAALALIAISLIILAASVHDALRISERRPDEMVLKPRILTVVGGAAALMVIVVIWNQGFVS